LAHPSLPGLFAGVEVVVHLAGEDRRDASWESLLPDNIQASYQVAAAAPRAGCRRLIVASSVHAVYASPTRPVAVDDPVAPANLYGVTKCFVEGAGVLVRASRGDVGSSGSDRRLPNPRGGPGTRRGGLDGR
jgi:uronate dehydrogenase